MNNYPSSLRLFKIDLVNTSSTSNLSTVYNFSVDLAFTLSSLYYFCFKYLDRVKRVIIQASDIANRLSINVRVILWIHL